MARNYAALPHEYLEEMEALNDAEFGRLTRALLVYSMTGEQIALCGNERFYAKRVMAQEDRFKANYKELSKVRSEAGKAGANAKWQGESAIANDGKRWQTIADGGKAMANDSKNGNTKTKTKTDTLSSDDDKSNRARTTRFTPPSVDEVAEYVRSRGSSIDAERFVDYYSANGWKVGKNPMRDWKAAVRTWEQRRKEETGEQPTKQEYRVGKWL